ncbi:MAG: hypothetical protein LUF25_01855 [Phascolarctobacterium sp.]|nr:hypothetical protein [Phascolarctobacterium sp.]
MKEKNYGDTTWRAYAKLMNDMSTRFTAEISPYRNLFNITSVEDFDEIDAKIGNNSGFADYNDNPGNYGNKCYEGTASAALNMYKKFLRVDEGSKKNYCPTNSSDQWARSMTASTPSPKNSIKSFETRESISGRP